MVTVREKFDTFHGPSERHTPNDEYKSIVTAKLQPSAYQLNQEPNE